MTSSSSPFVWRRLTPSAVSGRIRVSLFSVGTTKVLSSPYSSYSIFVLISEIDYQQVLQWGDVASLPARKLYEDVLPSVVSDLAPEVPYHRGSPYGGKGWDTADPTVGDVHQWNIWAGTGVPYQEYDWMGGRFVRFVSLPFFIPSTSLLLVTVDGTGADASTASLECQPCQTFGRWSTGWATRKMIEENGGRRVDS
jgi:hypothetical protein